MSIKIEPQAYPYLAAIGAVAIFIVLILVIIIKASNNNARKISEKQRQMQAAGILYSYTLPILSGLNLPEETLCKVTSLENDIEIEGNGIKYRLKKEKILDVCTKTNTEIEKQYVSSIGGAVGGAVLFGPIGAMIGGRAKKKVSRSVHTYLIFTYDKEGSPDYIAFVVTGVPHIAKQIINEFKGRTSQRVIDL